MVQPSQKTMSELIDTVERIREELLHVQRELEEFEGIKKTAPVIKVKKISNGEVR